MKKYLLRAVLIAALAVTAAFGTAAFDAEPVESASERVSTANEMALSEESASLAMDANGEIELTFGLQAVPQVNVGTTEASYEIFDDGEYGYVTVTGKGYAGIVTVTAGEETKTVHLYGGSKSKPGLNIYTGTTEALNIGDLEGTELMKDGKLALSNMGNRPVVQKDGKLGADFSDGGNIINTTDFGTERPLGISLDYQGTSTWASVINNGGTTYWNYKKWRPQATTDANWVSVSNKSEGGKCAQASKADHTHTHEKMYIWGEGRADYYLNNLNITPYYKATYYDTDGTTVLGTDYFLYDAAGSVATTYAPSFAAEPTLPESADGKIYSLSGWTTKKGASLAMDSVALANADIALYPVFGEFSFDTMDAAVTSKTYSLEAFTNAGITIESAAFDYGFTDATAVFADNAITVTGKGYAGVISVLLTDSDGNTYPYEIRLFGGKYSKPGLNIYTGTTEALDIGDLGGLISGNKLALTAMGKLGVAEKDGKLGVNALDGKILLNADFDRSRAIGISFDYMGKFSWLSVFNSHGWQEFWSFHSWKPVTYDTWRSVSNVAKGGTCKTCGNDPAKSEDGDHASFDVHGGEYGGSYIVFLNNLNFTPYYKITYVNGETTTDVYALYDENGVLLTSYTPDASVLGAEFYTLAAESDTYYPVTAPITLDHKDITLYAYTPDENAPINAMQTSIRPASATASAGIRFLSTVRAKTQLTADEYGYIVAREDKLLADGGTVDALKFGADTTYKNDGKNFTGTTANGVKYAGAVNYSKANGIRILYDTDADTGDIRFTGVTIGLDGAYTKNGITYANRYAERFTARPYVKIGDVTYYGACYTTSLAEKAQALIDSGDTNEEYRTIVEQAGKEA